MLAFVIKRGGWPEKFPSSTPAWTATRLVYKAVLPHRFCSADTPNGLVVPVLSDADQKASPNQRRKWARTGRKPARRQPPRADKGRLRAIALGGIGGTHFHAHHRAPRRVNGHSGRVQRPDEALWDGKQFVPRLTLPLSAGADDHRVIDGAAARRGSTPTLAQVLADFRRILL